MISSPKPAKGAVPRKRVKYPFSRKPLNNLANLPSSSISFRDILKQLEERLSHSSKDLMRRANDAFEIGSFARAIHKVEARATRIIEISFSLSLSLHPLFQGIQARGNTSSRFSPTTKKRVWPTKELFRLRRSNYVSSARGNAQYSNYPSDEYHRLMRMYANNAATGRGRGEKVVGWGRGWKRRQRWLTQHAYPMPII